MPRKTRRQPDRTGKHLFALRNPTNWFLSKTVWAPSFDAAKPMLSLFCGGEMLANWTPVCADEVTGEWVEI